MQTLKKDASDGLFHAKMRVEIFCDNHPGFVRVLKQVALCAVAVALGMWFTEYPINPGHWLGAIDPGHWLLNMIFLGGMFAILYLVGQRARGTVVVYWFACMALGIANHYVLLFKGAPVIPSDLLALGTAAEVAGGYDYTPDGAVITTVLVFALAVFVLFKFVPKVRFESLLQRAIALLCAVMVAGAGLFVFYNVDVADATDSHIYAWHPEQTMKAKGTWLCDFVMAQALIVTAPEGYSADVVDELMEQASDNLKKRGVTTFGDKGDVLASGEQIVSSEADDTVKPNVIVVMNETFYDLSIFDESEGQEAATLPTYAKIAKESVMSGTAYVSVYGAGTCNSEFECLTGSTLEFCGNGAYPYEFYDLSDAGNLAEYYKSLGYETTAIHPADASNWSRDVVYPDMGFETFLDITAFEGADQLRNKTTDAATYDKAVDVLKSSDKPQFIFDITYMNHSGYSTGLLPREMMVDISCNGERHTNLTEYASIIQESDRQLQVLIDELEQLDEPTIVVMFGDHCPNFINDYFAEDDTLTGSARVGEAMKRYSTPYFVWANYDVEAPEMATSDSAKASRLGSTQGSTGVALDNGNEHMTNLSLGYLGVAVAETAGLPLTDYMGFIADSHEVLPVISYVGYMDAAGVWHNYDEVIDDTSTKEAQEAYAQVQKYGIMQYWNLFDRSSADK